MPLPKPRQGEGRQEFIGRCMADETMQSEFPDESQRAAVCYRQWRNRGKVMSKTLEKKAIVRPFEVKAVNAEERTFEGLASTWDLDLVGDVIHRGAFRRTLSHWRKSGRVIPLIDQHNYGSVRSVVGKLIAAKETEDGLWTRYQVIDGPDGDEVLRRIEGGYVTGLSIGFRPVKVEEPSDEERKRGIWRHIKEVQLLEVSVVIWPANDGARIDIDSVKSLLAAMKDRDLTDDDMAELKALRDDIDALLNGIEAPDSPDSGTSEPAEPDGLASEDQLTAIRQKMLALKLRRLAV